MLGNFKDPPGAYGHTGMWMFPLYYHLSPLSHLLTGQNESSKLRV